MKTISTMLMLILLLPLAVVQAGPVSNAFTYQGRLDLDGAPVAGQVDLQFYLHDAETGGTQIAGGYQFNNVVVDNGVFSVLLDWAAINWNGDERWLEIRVRNPHDPGNTQPFTTLDPRQRITVVPYAIHALNGGSGGGSGFWAGNGSAISNTNTGLVGIGRTDRVTTAEVFGLEGPPNAWGGMYIRSLGGTTSKPFYGYKTDSYQAYHYISELDGKWHFENGGDLYFTRTGELGVGISNPTSKIAANGLIESTSGGFKFPDGSVQTTAGGGVGGSTETLDLFDASATQTVELWASTTGNGTADGSVLRLRRPNGNRTVSLFAGNSAGADLSMYNANGIRTAHFDAEYTTGQGALLEIKQGDGGHGVRIQAHGFSGTSDRGGEIELYTAAGAQSITLHGDYNNTGESRIVANVVEITGGADLSEHFDVAAGARAVEPGSVVSIDPASPGDLRLSTEAYDRKVAGIVSGADGVKPGLLMGQKGTVADGEYPVALTGRVYCKVDASFGVIEPGDLLTTSPTAGHAMKVGDHSAAQGAILGKAMTSLETGQGMVLVLVSLQ